MMNENVLIVHNYYQIPGGEDVVVANESKMLRENGHKVVLYSRHNKELKSMSSLRKLLLPFTTIYNPQTYKDICKIIRDENIDIVHVHNTLNLISPAVYYAAKKCKVPVIQTIHNYRLLCPAATFYRNNICEDCVNKGLGSALKHKCYRSSFSQTLICVLLDKIHRRLGIYNKLNYLCLTEYNKGKIMMLNKVGAHINENQIYVKPNFMPEYSETIVPHDKRENRLIFAGRLDETKGVDILIKAWEKYTEGCKNIGTKKLMICGTGPLEEWCRSYVQEKKLEGIELMGATPHDEVVKLLGHSKAMILPTRWYEGFPMSIAESFSVATMVVGPNMGNVGSIVTNGVTGLTYENNDFDSLVSTIDYVFDENNNEVCEQMGKQAYEEFTDKYTQDKNYLILKDIYENCISSYNLQ